MQMQHVTQQVSFSSSQYSSFDYQQPMTVANTPGPFTLSLNLISGKYISSSNVYCKIRIGCQTFKSSVSRNTTSPMWNTTYASIIYSQSDPISVRVFAERTFRDKKLGEIVIDPTQYTLNVRVNQCHPFQCGEINMGITITKHQ